MSIESEFMCWLRRPDKTFLENLKFATKSWQSAEFTLSSKYELVVKWMVEHGKNQMESVLAQDGVPEEFVEFLKLRVQPGLVSMKAKSNFVEMFLENTSTWQLACPTRRLAPELLLQLLQSELLCDFFRTNYELYGRSYALLLHHYIQYLKLNAHQVVECDNQDKLQKNYEILFFTMVMNSLHENAKRASDMDKLREAYARHIVQPLNEVLLVLRQYDVFVFFEELVNVEKIICEGVSNSDLLKHIQCFPVHAQMISIECAVAIRGRDEDFLSILLKAIIPKGANSKNPYNAESLMEVAYTFGIFRKFNVMLSFNISKKTTALRFLGQSILSFVSALKDTHLKGVLMVLCATLRLNPLILEQQIFEIATWIIVAPKSEDQEERELFDEFLVLFIEMFSQLRRSDKCVLQLLRALKKWLQDGDVPAYSRKRKLKEVTHDQHKKPREQGECTSEDGQAKPIETNGAYFRRLLKEFHRRDTASNENFRTETTVLKSFPQLQNAWPSDSVGTAFTKLIIGIVSKTSLTIWKTLLHNFKELLESFGNETALSKHNTYFFVDLHAAMLCQYFAGARLTEHLEKYTEDIHGLRSLTADVLSSFGRFLLGREHNDGTMNAFLECSFYFGNFELLLSYYRPDGLTDASLMKPSCEQLHSFLSEEEWTLIQQRVLNFGKSHCKFLLNRLLLQRMHVKLLLPDASAERHVELGKLLLSDTLTDQTQLRLLVQEPSTEWFITHATRSEKEEFLCELLLDNTELIMHFASENESMQLVVLKALERLTASFVASSKGSLLAALNCDFEALRLEVLSNNVKNRLKCFKRIFQTHLQDSTVKKIPREEVDHMIKILQQIPVGELPPNCKIVTFAFVLALYCDLKAAKKTKLATAVLKVLIDFLRFGPQVTVFKYFPPLTLLQLLSISECWEFYEYLVANIRKEDDQAIAFVTSIAEILSDAQKNDQLSDDQCRLMVSCIESLGAPNASRLRKHLHALLEVYAAYVKQYFEKNCKVDTKEHKAFVEFSLAGFAPYLNAVIHAKMKEEGPKTANNMEKISFNCTDIDDNFRKICKIYLGFSLDYKNRHGVQLVKAALIGRKLLHIDQDEIQFILTNYWRQLNKDLVDNPNCNKELDANVVMLIINNKTNEDLLLTLKEIGSMVATENLTAVFRLLSLIAGCSLSTIKGAIFSDQFRQITSDLILHLKSAREQSPDIDVETHVLSLLSCYDAVVKNKRIPLSYIALDDILSFLMDINIKRFPISDANVRSFYALHLAMSDLCANLLKHHEIMLSDRIPQLMHIFKDMVQAIVWYKCEREKNSILTEEDLNELAELALKLEVLMHLIRKQSVHVKRVAPIVLTFILSLMVANKRTTTLYPKIKTHIESLCYNLIEMCDRNVSNFILRSSNEAARQLYESLAKNYKKYHKFEGKV